MHILLRPRGGSIKRRVCGLCLMFKDIPVLSRIVATTGTVWRSADNTLARMHEVRFTEAVACKGNEYSSPEAAFVRAIFAYLLRNPSAQQLKLFRVLFSTLAFFPRSQINIMKLSCLPSVLVIFGVGFSTNLINAQLVGCDAAGCPRNPKFAFDSFCDLDGIVYNDLGITNFTSALSSSPFTWTIGISETADPSSSTKENFSRGFYLGAPPPLNMSDLTTITGCALFFEGISSILSFPGTLDTSIGTCSDALSATCVTDLLAQAASTLLQISKSSGNICEALTDALSNRAPKSCSVAQDGSWGVMTAKSECRTPQRLEELLTFLPQTSLVPLLRCP
jgi:hypothetical protein